MTEITRSDERMSDALGRKVAGHLFARRHESSFMRDLARASIRDLRLWRRLFG